MIAPTQIDQLASMNKTSAPIEFDVDITGCNDFKITFINDDHMLKDVCIGNAGFYQ